MSSSGFRTTCRRNGASTRPPRYRLMSAAALLPRRPPEPLRVAFEAACPGCGRTVLVTHVQRPDRIEFLIADHDCVEAPIS